MSPLDRLNPEPIPVGSLLEVLKPSHRESDAAAQGGDDGPGGSSAITRRINLEGYARKLRLKLVDLSEGRAVVEMVPMEDDANIFGMVHGGPFFLSWMRRFRPSAIPTEGWP
jgi:hypothetical protein